MNQQKRNVIDITDKLRQQQCSHSRVVVLYPFNPSLKYIKNLHWVKCINSICAETFLRDYEENYTPTPEHYRGLQVYKK